MTLTEIATILIGNGILIGILNFIFRYYERKSDRDLEARRKAEHYYLPLHGHIAVLQSQVSDYKRSLTHGRIKAFEFNECEHKELTSREILNDFRKSYEKFTRFYIEKKREGYEIFVSEGLRKALIDFWRGARIFYEDPENLKNSEMIDDFTSSADDTLDLMEKLFGLK